MYEEENIQREKKKQNRESVAVLSQGVNQNAKPEPGF